jgi:hypothetical protein
MIGDPDHGTLSRFVLELNLLVQDKWACVTLAFCFLDFGGEGYALGFSMRFRAVS